MEAEKVLDIQGVGKSFPGVRALNQVNMEVGPGEVVALVGENGAGKSTLLKVLCGEYALDDGRILVAGKADAHKSPAAAREAGFRLVRQEPEIVPDISVAENIFIGELPTRGGRVDFREAQRRVLEILERYGFDGLISVTALGKQLSPAQRHIVEIVRALKDGVRVVAFDEPTSSLTHQETERLFELIGQLKQEGIGVVYVSHRLREVMTVSDRIVILRDGRHVGTLVTQDATDAEVVRLMVGRDLSGGFKRDYTGQSDVVLSVRNLSSRWHHDISFDVHRGEILGIAGLVGAGRSELAKVIFGDYHRRGGTISLNGKQVHIGHPSDAIAAGIGFAPEDRKSEGLIMVRSVLENASVAVFNRLAQWGFLRKGRMVEAVMPLIRKLEIKTPGLDQEVGKLSGGNQQKVVLARWLAAKPDVLILDEPTRAVDVGAKSEIYHLIDDLARAGMAIVVISSEMPELLALADRVVVMRDGTISEPVSKAEATEERILNLALGVQA